MKGGGCVNTDTIENIISVCASVVCFFATYRWLERTMTRRDTAKLARLLLGGCKATSASSWWWSEENRCFMIPDYYYDNTITLRRIKPADSTQPGELRCDVVARRSGVEGRAQASYYDTGVGDAWVLEVSKQVAWLDAHSEDKRPDPANIIAASAKPTPASYPEDDVLETPGDRSDAP